MGAPLFSVVIPTRNRPELARRAIKFALDQSFDDLEVLVLENSDHAEIRATEFADDRLRVIPSDRVLTMPDNWERTLRYSRGEYVVILSDKDLILPGALETLAGIILRDRSEVITFRKSAYDVKRRRAIVHCFGKVWPQLPTRPILAQWFGRVRHLSDAPMIYNSIVRRRTLEDLRDRYGRVFVGSSPDVASGVLLAAALTSYTLVDRPLVLAIVGPWSIGNAAREGRAGAAAVFMREFDSDPIAAAGLVQSNSGGIAETLVACKNQFADILGEWSIRWSRYVANVLAELEHRGLEGAAYATELRLLRGGAGRLYSFREFRMGVVAHRLGRVALSARRTLKAALARLSSLSLSVSGAGRQSAEHGVRGSSRYDRVARVAAAVGADLDSPQIAHCEQQRAVVSGASTMAFANVLNTEVAIDLLLALTREFA